MKAEGNRSKQTYTRTKLLFSSQIIWLQEQGKSIGFQSASWLSVAFSISFISNNASPSRLDNETGSRDAKISMMRSRRHSIFLLCSIAAVEWELLGKTPPMRLGENICKLIELAAKQTQWFPADTVNKQVRAIWRSGDLSFYGHQARTLARLQSNSRNF